MVAEHLKAVVATVEAAAVHFQTAAVAAHLMAVVVATVVVFGVLRPAFVPEYFGTWLLHFEK